MTLTHTEALEALRERLGNDPDCDCEDCTTDREIVAQLALLDEGEAG